MMNRRRKQEEKKITANISQINFTIKLVFTEPTVSLNDTLLINFVLPN